MVDLIIQRFGAAAIARIAAAYRDGATDADALRAGTGEAADTLYADYFRSFGADRPSPVTPDPLLPSTVLKPGSSAQPQPSGEVRPQPAPDAGPRQAGRASDWLVLVPLLLAAAVGLAAATFMHRRAAKRGDG
jgi:hypothetical protein